MERRETYCTEVLMKINWRRLWEPLDGIEATLSEHRQAAMEAQSLWALVAVGIVVVVAYFIL